MKLLKTTLLIAIFFIQLFSLDTESHPSCNEQPCIPPSLREERELFIGLSQESQRLYFSLDCEGKNLAIVLAKETKNKNLAIQEAALEMARRKKKKYPNQKDNQRQIQENSGQSLYNEKFGY